MLKTMNVIETIGEIGLKLEEKAVSETILNNQPTKVKPARGRIIYKSNSFLFIILRNIDFAIFIVALILYTIAIMLKINSETKKENDRSENYYNYFQL